MGHPRFVADEGLKRTVMAEFLFEIGLEEVPARMIAGAQAELQRRVWRCWSANGWLIPTSPAIRPP